MEKIKSILLSEKLVLALIILVGLYLRISGLDKVDGLWLDEIMSYDHAKNTFPWGIISDLCHNDFHAPLYYFILHFWLVLFGDNDLIIRSLSVLFGVLTIPVMYLAGKELHNKETGLLAAAFISINSFLIYYSQEVRFYSLLAFLGALSLLFLLKAKNKPDLKKYLSLTIINTCILCTVNIGFVFVFLEALIFLMYLLIHKKEFKIFLYYQLFTLILYLPCLPLLIHQSEMASKSFIGVFSWIRFDYSSLLINIIQSWFSPVITDGIYNPASYHKVVANAVHSGAYYVVLFIILPVICSVATIRSAIKGDFTAFIVVFVFLFLSVGIIATLMGKFCLLARYTTPIIPLVTLCASYGFINFNNKQLSVVIVAFLIVMNLLYLIISPDSAFRIPRVEGLGTVSQYLNSLNLSNKDIIIMPYGGKYIGKYYPAGRAEILPLDIVSFKDNPDKQFDFFDRNLLKVLNKDNSYDLLRSYFADPQPSAIMDSYLRINLVDKLDNSNYAVLVLTPALREFDDRALRDIASKNGIYKATPIFGMLISKITNDIIKINSHYLKFVSAKNIGIWTIVVFRKQV